MRPTCKRCISGNPATKTSSSCFVITASCGQYAPDIGFTATDLASFQHPWCVQSPASSPPWLAGYMESVAPYHVMACQMPAVDLSRNLNHTRNHNSVSTIQHTCSSEYTALAQCKVCKLSVKSAGCQASVHHTCGTFFACATAGGADCA